MRNHKGFTLLEILVVIVMMSIFVAVVIIAINPTKQIGVARDAQRWADLNTLLSATHQYTIDHGANPPTISTIQGEICRTYAPDCSGLVDLSILTIASVYLSEIPADPTEKTTNGTGYEIVESTAGRLTLFAP